MRRFFNRKVLAAAFAVFLLLGGSIWGIMHLQAEAQMSKFREMSKELRSEDMRNLPEDQRREAYKKLREEYEKLSEDQQRELRHERFERWLADEEKEMDEFFALPPDQRIAALDDQIRREEERRREWEARRAEREQERARERANQARTGNPTNNNNGNRGNQAQSGNNNDRRRRSRTPEERDARSKRFLDYTSPEWRAKRDEYRRLRDERRKALGLPERSSRGRRGR